MKEQYIQSFIDYQKQEGQNHINFAKQLEGLKNLNLLIPENIVKINNALNNDCNVYSQTKPFMPEVIKDYFGVESEQELNKAGISLYNTHNSAPLSLGLHLEIRQHCGPLETAVRRYWTIRCGKDWWAKKKARYAHFRQSEQKHNKFVHLFNTLVYVSIYDLIYKKNDRYWLEKCYDEHKRNEANLDWEGEEVQRLIGRLQLFADKYEQKLLDLSNAGFKVEYSIWDYSGFKSQEIKEYKFGDAKKYISQMNETLEAIRNLRKVNYKLLFFEKE